ncbi:MAG: hypothetical protein ABJN26_14025 [Stappiaceae bacterium]
MSLPVGHWASLDWMAIEGFTDLQEQIEIAWNGWKHEMTVEPDFPFAHALGFAIQEAYEQYESWKSGFTNDNMDDK